MAEGKFDGDAFSRGDVMRELKELKRRLAGLETARRLENSSFGTGGIRVHSGGSVTVEGGGSITARHADGSIGLTYGTLTGVNTGLQSIGLLVQDDSAGDNLDIFRARKHPIRGKDILVGSGDNPANGFDVSANFMIVRHANGQGTFLLDLPTTGSAANLHVDATDNGRLLRSTSSLRYKQDIADHNPDPREVLTLRPRSWRDKTEASQHPDIDRRHVGFVAEEVADALPGAVDLDSENEPDSISLPAIVAGLVSLCQDQQRRIENLETQLGVTPPDPGVISPRLTPRPPLPATRLPEVD